MRIKEFELLWYLASREGEVISKSELLEKYGDMTITKMLTLSMSTYIEFAKIMIFTLHYYNCVGPWL